jgi:hypothetical protein
MGRCSLMFNQIRMIGQVYEMSDQYHDPAQGGS